MDDKIDSPKESTSPTFNRNNESFKSDYESFIQSQIDMLVGSARNEKPEMTREEELKLVIAFCKNYLVESSNENNEEARRSEVVDKLVELKLELEQIKELSLGNNDTIPISKICGHEFVVQSANGKNPYCDVCVSLIWRIAQKWLNCQICGFRIHEKCFEDVKRPCVSLKIAKLESPLTLKFNPESSLPSQNFECAECRASIGFEDMPGVEEPRLCAYTGQYYCRRCHWNNEMIIPAHLIRNWDNEKRLVCRASKQFLISMLKRPIIDLEKENPLLFKYVNVLSQMKHLRRNIMLMKCYFISCKKARKLRILQYLNRYQHFVESDNLYTLNDLIQLSSGKMLNEIQEITNIFNAHITEECEICMGNAFICELCDDQKVIYPFNENVSMCTTCFASFHTRCFNCASKRCSRCARRKIRKLARLEEDFGDADCQNQLDEEKEEKQHQQQQQ